MNQTIKLDTRKREGKYGEARIAPLRRGERNNALLTVKICANGVPYDLAGKTASLVATTAAGKLVGPYPMEAAEAGIARIVLPAALYSAVGSFSGYVEIREGETLVDTTDSFGGKVIECADLDSEQAEEFTPLLGELQNAVAEEAKRVEAEKARVQAETERATGFAEAKQAAQAATKAANDAATEAKKAAGSASAAAESASTAGIKATDAAAKAESDVRAFVNAASTAVGDAIAGAKADVDAAVKRSDAATAKAEAAVKTADSANTAATKAVSDARDAIAEVKVTEAKLYPAAENILVGSETGAVAHVDDAFDGSTLRKITVEGACKQDGIPSPDTPKPITVIEHPTVKVVGRNLSNPSGAYYFAAQGAPSAEQITDGFRFVITNNDTRLLAVPCDVKKGDTVVVNFDSKKISGNATRIALYFPRLNAYLQIGKPHVMEGDADFIGVYVDADTTGEFEITNFRVSFSADDGYAPYASQSLTFTLPAEHPYLAKLPDGTADEIVVDEEGNVELVARVGVDKNVREVGDFSQGKWYSLRTSIVPYASASVPSSIYGRHVLCNALPYKNAVASGEGIYRTWNGIYVKDTSGRTKEEIQAEVDKNAPLTVVATMPETRYPLGKIEMPKAQDSIINVWTDAEVTPNTGIKYVRDVNIVVANLEAAIASITEG